MNRHSATPLYEGGGIPKLHHALAALRSWGHELWIVFSDRQEGPSASRYNCARPTRDALNAVQPDGRLDLDAGFRVGDAEVLPRRGTLRIADRTAHIEPKVMEVLVMLARSPGQVVTREEFLDQVWPQVVVGDQVLSRAIHLLRVQLRDTRAEPHYIQTVPRAGYRLVAPVGPICGEDAGDRREAKWLEWLAFAVICACIAGILLGDLTDRMAGERAPDLGGVDSIAIVGFATRGVDSDRLASVLLGEIVRSLVRQPGIHIVYRAYDPLSDPCEVATRLRTDAVLTGRIDRQDDRVRVAFQWTSGSDCYVRQSGTYAIDAADISTARQSIAAAITARVTGTSRFDEATGEDLLAGVSAGRTL